MIVDDFHVVCCAFTPNEANAPLIVDAYRTLTLAIAVQRFKSIARRYAQVDKPVRRRQILQFAESRAFERLESSYRFSAEEALDFRIFE